MRLRLVSSFYNTNLNNVFKSLKVLFILCNLDHFNLRRYKRNITPNIKIRNSPEMFLNYLSISSFLPLIYFDIRIHCFSTLLFRLIILFNSLSNHYAQLPIMRLVYQIIFRMLFTTLSRLRIRLLAFIKKKNQVHCQVMQKKDIGNV